MFLPQRQESLARGNFPPSQPRFRSPLPSSPHILFPFCHPLRVPVSPGPPPQIAHEHCTMHSAAADATASFGQACGPVNANGAARLQTHLSKRQLDIVKYLMDSLDHLTDNKIAPLEPPLLCGCLAVPLPQIPHNEYRSRDRGYPDGYAEPDSDGLADS